MERSFPVILCELRKEKGISQKEAAQALGVSQALLSHYEKGIRECGQDFLLRAADYYKVTCDYLLGRSSSKNGFSEHFKAMDGLPDDKKFSDATLLRALVAICEKLLNNSPHSGIDHTMLFGVELYRLLLQLAAADIIPKSWLSNSASDYLNPFSLGVVNVVCSTLIKHGKGASTQENEPAPLCIKTLCDASHDFIMKTIAQGTPPIPDKYKR